MSGRCAWLTADMADADPLGVDVNVTFDNVGGLDNRESTSVLPYRGLTYTRHQSAQGNGCFAIALP